MKSLTTSVCVVVIASACIAPSAGAQTLADQKAAADIEKVQADTEKVRADIEKAQLDARKVQLDTIAAAKSGFAGEGAATTTESGAEGAYITTLLTEEAAGKIAGFVNGAMKPDGRPRVRIVVGRSPPNIAQWVAIQRLAPLLAENLEKAAKDWKTATAKPVRTEEFGLGPRFVFNPLAAITVITTALSVLKTNTTVAGLALPTANEELATALDRELNTHGALEADWALRLVATTPKVDAALEPSETAFKNAAGPYREYLTVLAQAEKPEKVQEGQRIAGGNLQAAVTAYQSFHTALFTPNANGELPALIAERQANDIAVDTPILYVRNFKAAISVETRKNLFTGIVGAPIFVRGVVTAQFSYVDTNNKWSRSGSVVCVMAQQRLTEVAEADVTKTSNMIVPPNVTCDLKP